MKFVLGGRLVLSLSPLRGVFTTRFGDSEADMLKNKYIILIDIVRLLNGSIF